ncbi:hypothetical protein BRC82_10685 [Halobacteriales archaeon QS_1_67_19]|nr:MAG: hypothetical protein BRC82_10685 [Halobacteriales archaeon QS_1_67_19]
MNRHSVLAVALSAVLMLGVVAGGFTAAAAATPDAPTDKTTSLTALQDEGDDEQEGDDEGQDNETDGERITIIEAMEVAQNETEDRNGTVVGAEVGQREGGLLDFGEDDESVYTVDVLLDDGTHIEMAVNATNGSVVETGEAEEGFLESVFGEDNIPDEPLNLSAMHTAIEAAELAQNETAGAMTGEDTEQGADNETEMDENETDEGQMNDSQAQDLNITRVNLNNRDDGLVYEVHMERGGEEFTVIVDAMKDGEGVINVEGAEGMDMGGGNETDEGGG